MSEADRAEIEEAVGKELAGQGVQGTIALAGAALELSTADGGAPVSIEVGAILGQWPLLPGEMRARKAAEMAGRLLDALHAARRAEGRHTGTTAPVDTQGRAQVVRAALGLFGLLAAIGVARFAVPRIFPGEKVEAGAGVPAEAETARAERLARACEASRDRLYEGSSFGPFALEGWAVELWLARRDGTALREHPALTGLAPGGKLTAASSAELAGVIDGRVELADGFTGEAAQRRGGWAAAAVVFRDGYGRAFFEDEKRPAFIALAEHLVAATGADHAALYARCAHLTTHDVGAWFHGPDAAGAGAVLVYQMGAFAETRVIDRAALTALHAPGDLDALRGAVGVLQGTGPGTSAGSALVRLVTAQGGSVEATRGTTLVFPLAAPARPLAAAKELARKMGVGVPSAE